MKKFNAAIFAFMCAVGFISVAAADDELYNFADPRLAAEADDSMLYVETFGLAGFSQAYVETAARPVVGPDIALVATAVRRVGGKDDLLRAQTFDPPGASLFHLDMIARPTITLDIVVTETVLRAASHPDVAIVETAPRPIEPIARGYASLF